MAYPKHAAKAGVPASPDLPAVERAVLEHWAADKTFPASVENRSANALSSGTSCLPLELESNRRKRTGVLAK